jgi:hypothetical protein
MLKYGPVDVVAFAIGEPRFDGTIFAELQKQVAKGTIRVLDAMVLFKQLDGQCLRVDLEDLDDEDKASLGFIETGTRGLFDSDDELTLFEGMVPDSAVVALAIEHKWSVDLINAIVDSGVEVALNFRVPAVVINEAFASIGQ